MGIPLAASPTSPTPGFWITVDLVPKKVSPGSQPIRACILAPKNTTGGNITDNTEIRKILSVEDFEAAGGQGCLGALTYTALRRKHPNCQVDYVGPTPSAGSPATGRVTVSGTISVDYTARITISGRLIEVPWLVGETPAQFHAKAVTYVGRYTRELFCTPSVGSPDGLLLTAKGAGPAGNDITLTCTLVGGAGGSVSVTAFSGGSTEPDYTTALATIQGREYDFIGLALSNADVVSTTGNFSRLDTHVTGLDSGPAAKLQQAVCAHTGLRTAAAVSSAARNEQQLELFCLQGAQALPCEVMGDEIGGRMEGIAKQISANRIGEEMLVYGAADPVSNNPTPVQSDAALLAGLSVGGYLENGTPYVIRAVTTYSATPTGAQVLPTDCNEIDAIYQYVKDMRAAIPVEFKGAKIARDSAAQDEGEDLPEGVVEERDVRAFIVARTRTFWIPKGVIERTSFNQSVDDGSLVVRVNDTDETQLDIFVPLKPFKNLAKFGFYAAKDG